MSGKLIGIQFHPCYKLTNYKCDVKVNLINIYWNLYCKSTIYWALWIQCAYI